MTIIEKAHELGEMIKDSKEMETLSLAEKVQQEDSDAQQLIADFNIKRLNLAREIQGGKISEEEFHDIVSGLLIVHVCKIRKFSVKHREICRNKKPPVLRDTLKDRFRCTYPVFSVSRTYKFKSHIISFQLL